MCAYLWFSLHEWRVPYIKIAEGNQVEGWNDLTIAQAYILPQIYSLKVSLLCFCGFSSPTMSSSYVSSICVSFDGSWMAKVSPKRKMCTYLIVQMVCMRAD